MSQYFVADPEELRLLSKKERDVYEMYRLEGKTKDQIAEALGIELATVNSHWSRAINKIERHRLLLQNPLAFINSEKPLVEEWTCTCNRKHPGTDLYCSRCRQRQTRHSTDIFRAKEGKLQKEEETKPDFIPIIGVDETPTFISQPDPRSQEEDSSGDVGPVRGEDDVGGEEHVSTVTDTEDSSSKKNSH